MRQIYHSIHSDSFTPHHYYTVTAPYACLTMNAHKRGRMLREPIEVAINRIIIADPSFTVDMPKLSPDLWDKVSILTPAKFGLTPDRCGGR